MIRPAPPPLLISSPPRPGRAATGSFAVHPLADVPEVRPGEDLPGLIAPRLPKAAPDESLIVVLASKILSKSENRHLPLSEVRPSREAEGLAEITGKDPRLVEVILQESTAVVRAARGVLIVRHRLGLVMANAGVDLSNLEPSAQGAQVLLLPRDPDGSAQAVRAGLKARFGIEAGVVVADSFGRAWRRGVVNVAIGAAGVPALVDLRGEPDRRGRPLEHTTVGYADLLASAAGLVMGEGAEGIPAAAVLGLPPAGPFTPASALLRPVSEDLFR